MIERFVLTFVIFLVLPLYEKNKISELDFKTFRQITRETMDFLDRQSMKNMKKFQSLSASSFVNEGISS